jgi:hypothetical protein
MIETKKESKNSKQNVKKYKAESPALQSMRLIAAPNPKDDLSDEELAAMCKEPGRSPELIQYLIDYIKKM